MQATPCFRLQSVLANSPPVRDMQQHLRPNEFWRVDNGLLAEQWSVADGLDLG